MLTRRLGRLTWPVSEIGYGLWGMGGWSGSNDDESIAALERSIELGCTFFDTALSYGDGKSERLLGHVLARHRGTPLVVATKIPPKNLRWPASPDTPLEEVFPADHIRASTEESLKNLGVTRVDLQQFHVWTDAWAADTRWQRAVDDLKREGLVRAVGVSVGRSNPADVVRALRTGVIDSVQTVYNIFERKPEDELFDVCRELDIAVIARVPFDEGSLTDTLVRGQTWPMGDFRNGYFAPDALAATLDRIDVLRPDLPRRMSMPEAALRFILSNPVISTVIPGMRRVRNVEANAAVSDGRLLSRVELSRLEKHRWRRSQG